MYKQSYKLKEMIRLRNEGWTCNEIAEYLDCSRQNIYSALSSAKKKNITYEKYPEICKWLHANECTIDEFANIMNLSPATIRNKLSGRTKFTLDEAHKISIILDQTIEEIFIYRKEL